MAQRTSIDVGGSTMDVLVEAPADRGARPAVLVMCHRTGLDGFTEDIARRLAAAGYLAAAPAVFHRQPADVAPERRRELLRDSEVIADVTAALDFVRALPGVDPGRVAILGHCMGGRMALLGACTSSGLSAAVAFYPGNMRLSWGDEGVTPFERLDALRCPVLGLFGNDDANPSPADVDALDAELDRLGVEHAFHRYGGAGHAFQNFLSPERYREGVSNDAWDRVLGFLGERLAG